MLIIIKARGGGGGGDLKKNSALLHLSHPKLSVDESFSKINNVYEILLFFQSFVLYFCLFLWFPFVSRSP